MKVTFTTLSPPAEDEQALASSVPTGAATPHAMTAARRIVFTERLEDGLM
ncbi:hypothetical protein [Roseomonas sp. HF4]|nr:hypothetical protein [Roseomonas sp. HF4]